MNPLFNRRVIRGAMLGALALEGYVLAAWGVFWLIGRVFPGLPPRSTVLLVSGLSGLMAGCIAWRERRARLRAEAGMEQMRAEMVLRTSLRTAEADTSNATLQAELAERRRVEAELERRVTERTRQLLESNTVLQGEIHERKRIAEALKNSRSLYHSLVENLPVHVWRTDLLGRYTFGNEYVMDYLGVQPDEFLGKTPFDFFTPEVAGKFSADDRWVLETGDPREVVEEFVTLNGRGGWVQTLKTPVHDTRGHMLGVQAISWDVTERKLAEEEMRRIQRQLEEVNRDLLSKNQEIQNFYHTLSHELKTPLTSAREFVSIVMDGLAGPLTETQMEYLGIARESCNQLRVCMNDLLDATRLETGKFSLELKPTSLADSLLRVMAVMRPAMARKKIELRHEIDPGLPVVIADENRLQQVVNNLLTNALKFTPEGGRIVVRAGPDSNDEGSVVISVTDTGCGMAAEQLERIFDRLYQIKGGDAATEQGVGLGLYICQELIRLHGGTILVESEPGQGSAFTVVLPVDAREANPGVLIVDDDAGLRDLLRQILEREQFRVTTVESGGAALEAMRRHAPDAVLLDLVMDGMDGADTIREIRREWGAVPVILHTGYPNEDTMARALECSPVTLLAKPCTAEQLVQTIRGALRTRDTTFRHRPSNVGTATCATRTP